MEKINCPICGIQSRYYTNKKLFEYYKCDNCETIFLVNYPKNYSEIYNSNYFNGGDQGFGYVSYDEDKEPMRDSFIKYLDIIEKYNKKKGKLFDVGCATGYFLSIAKEKGFIVSGIEISDYASRMAINKGLDVINGDLSKLPNDKFDVVTMLDVLEHIPNPKGDIRSVSNILNNGGLLVINTPNSSSFFAQIMGKFWHLIIPPEHINILSKKSINILLDEEGFNVLYIGHIGKKFTIEYIFNMLYKWLKIDIFQKIAKIIKRSRLGRMGIPLDFRDNMFVIAKKR